MNKERHPRAWEKNRWSNLVNTRKMLKAVKLHPYMKKTVKNTISQLKKTLQGTERGPRSKTHLIRPHILELANNYSTPIQKTKTAIIAACPKIANEINSVNITRWTLFTIKATLEHNLTRLEYSLTQEN